MKLREFGTRDNGGDETNIPRDRISGSRQESLRAAVVGVAHTYGAYGYRMVTAMLRKAGWKVNHKRVARIWREEGLKVPRKQRKRKHLWLADGSCVRLRPTHRNHVWSYDFVEDRIARRS